MRKITSALAAFGFVICAAWPGMAEGAPTGMPLVAGADSAGGYAGEVLVKLLPLWQPPAGASGVVTIDLRIGSDGRPLFCEASRKSGNVALDESPCQAVVRAGAFPAPPYGAITEVYLTFVTDQGAFKNNAAQEQATPKQRRDSIRPKVLGRGGMGVRGKGGETFLQKGFSPLPPASSPPLRRPSPSQGLAFWRGVG